MVNPSFSESQPLTVLAANAISSDVPSSEFESQYRIDPFFSSILPRLTAEQYLQLKENIRRDNRISKPLTVWNGILIDGEHRDRAYRELLAEGGNLSVPAVEKMEFSSKAEAAQWAIDNGNGTRGEPTAFGKINTYFSNKLLMAELNETAQKAMLAGVANPKPTLDLGSVDETETKKVSATLAKMVGVSESTAKEIIAVIRHGEFVPMVQAGEITAHSAYRAIRGHENRVQKRDQIEQNLPAAHEAVRAAAARGQLLGSIHLADVLVGLGQLPDNSVSLVLTSPPYPLEAVEYPNWSYDGDYPAYLAWMRQVFAECKRVLMNGGRLVVNYDTCNIPEERRIGNEIRFDVRRDFANILDDLQMIWRDEIIWCKQNAVGTRPAIGSKGTHSNPRINNNSEYISVWAKDANTKRPENTDKAENDLIDLTADEQWQFIDAGLEHQACEQATDFASSSISRRVSAAGDSALHVLRGHSL